MKFSPSSTARLLTCDVRLQHVANTAIEDSPIDFGITCGHRDQDEQDRCCAKGLSKTPWPTSKHNKTPSMAFDFVPFIDGKAAWEHPQAFKDVSHHILMTADKLGIALRWGGDWSCDNIENDKWYDFPHIELK